MIPVQLAASAVPIVARKTHPGTGCAGVVFALVLHAALLCLLLQRHPASVIAPPGRTIDVTLETVAPEAAASAAMTETAPVADAAPVPPAIDPKRQPALPEAAASVPVPAQSTQAMAPDVAERRADFPVARQPPPMAPLILPRPVRRAPVRPVARRPATPAAEAQKTEPEPGAAPSVAAAAPSAMSAPPSQPAPPLQQQPVSPGAVGAWRTAMSAWLRAHRNYPDAARREGVEGRVVVRFTIDGDGLVTSVTLVGSSGSVELDEAAQGLLRGAHLPKPPTPDHLSVTLPINYALAQ